MKTLLALIALSVLSYKSRGWLHGGMEGVFLSMSVVFGFLAICWWMVIKDEGSY